MCTKQSNAILAQGVLMALFLLAAIIFLIYTVKKNLSKSVQDVQVIQKLFVSTVQVCDCRTQFAVQNE